MAADWVLLTLIFSLCLATSYGKRSGVSTMDDRIGKYASQSSRCGDPDPPGYGIPDNAIKPYCLCCHNSNSGYVGVGSTDGGFDGSSVPDQRSSSCGDRDPPDNSRKPYCLCGHNTNTGSNSGYSVGVDSTDGGFDRSGYTGSVVFGDNGSCGCSDCNIGYGYGDVEVLKQTIRDLTMKLDAIASGLLGQKKAMNTKAMAPESS